MSRTLFLVGSGLVLLFCLAVLVVIIALSPDIIAERRAEPDDFYLSWVFAGLALSIGVAVATNAVHIIRQIRSVKVRLAAAMVGGLAGLIGVVLIASAQVVVGLIFLLMAAVLLAPVWLGDRWTESRNS
ncbi:hypothetical protein BH10PSE1_BH10PSE1_14110 [soil metagenome]